MRADTFAEFVICIGAFYYYIIRPRRYALFFAKSFLFITLLTPVFAHMVADWDKSQRSDEETKTKNDVSVALLVSASVTAAPFTIAFDSRASWISICRQFAAYFVAQFALGAAMLYWLQDGVTLAHGQFLLRESPHIVAKYFANLPKDGWGQLKGLTGLLWEIFTDSVAKSLKGDEPAPTLALRHSDGRIVANITASM